MAEPEPESILPHEVPLPPRVDLWTAAVFLAAGIAIVYASWVMPRFEEQLGQLYTAPGLVPALYGIVIALLGLWLGARSIGRGALSKSSEGPRARREGYSSTRLVLCAVLCFIYAVILLGRLPFWAATAIFVFLFVLLFEWQPGIALRARLRPVATAAALGLATGWVVLAVFRDLFLVRLP